MPFSISLMRKIDVIQPELKEILWAVLEELERNQQETVAKTEFNELKEIVRELSRSTKGLLKSQDRTDKSLKSLAESQDRTDKSLKSLAESQDRTDKSLKSLAESQDRTDKSLKSLAESQDRTDKSLKSLVKSHDRLAESQKKTEVAMADLAKSHKITRSQIGGLSKSMAYALENEAFRKLPEYIKTHHQLIVKEKFVRKYIEGHEINIFVKAERDGQDVLVVGETVLKLDDRSKMGQLEKNIKIVEKQHNLPVVPLLITHFARPEILRKANEQGILVIQSFEWG